MNWYFKLLAKRPAEVLLVIGVFCIACIVVSFTTKRLPDFTDPTLGFEARGTDLGHKLTAWKNLLDETGPTSGQLVANPYEDFEYRNDVVFRKKNRKQGKKKKEKKNKKKQKLALTEKIQIIKNTQTMKDVNIDDYEDTGAGSQGRHDHWDYGKNVSYESTNKSVKMKKERTDNWIKLTKLYPPPLTTDVHTSLDGFFCESPNKEYSHFVMERFNHNVTSSLFEINALLAMCDLEEMVQTTDGYEDYCERELTFNKCCRPWSIPNYVALLSNKTHCFDIDADDIEYVKSLLTGCFSYYHSLRLSNDCVNFQCKNIPAECAQFNAVYNIFHYLADSQFMTINDTDLFLKYAVVFIPLAKSTKILPFYHSLSKQSLENEIIQIRAMDMGLKFALFDECLISDGWLLAIGGLFVVLCMWFYMASFFITFMTIVAVIFSLGVSYFIYTFIFELSFFPFMNLLAVVVLVGIGADDAFIFVKVWRCAIAEKMKVNGCQSPRLPGSESNSLSKPSPLSCIYKCLGVADKQSQNTNGFASTPSPFSTGDLSRLDTLSGLMACTLKHAAISMLVTSITTASAFYASFASSITTVRCFGVFAGTAVLVNYILMVTWLPASVSIAERLPCSFVFCSKLYTKKMQSSCKMFRNLEERLELAIVNLVCNMPNFWIVIFGLIGIVSGIGVFYWPKLQLPDSPDFRLFVGTHPFEVYDSEYKNFFWFEKKFISADSFKFPLRFVWGVKPVDQGSFLDPFSRGHLELDKTFNVSLPESQEFLLEFCQDIREQPFYQSNFGLLMPNCFIENLYNFMMRKCWDPMTDTDRSPCCENMTRPYPAHIFDECVPQSISSLYATPREYFIPGVAGPKFSRTILDNNSDLMDNSSITESSIAGKTQIPLVAALVVEFDSSQSYTMSYSEVRKFVVGVKEWLKKKVASAPTGMKNVWFISELEFYDLQDTLSEGTWIAIALSMVVSLLVLLLVTLNILISFFAIITVIFSILTTVAVLVLLGWKLNVLESVAVSTAIGLAVDFSLHYGVHYRLAPDRNRLESTKFALHRMIGPTAMAAITTGSAGAFMLPSSVLAYIQIGIFLVVVMTVSWSFATFFLMSVLRQFGPEYGFLQFQYPRFRSRNSGKLSTTKSLASDSNSGHLSNNPVSEQLLSGTSSAQGDVLASESHEMDSLTSNSVNKLPSHIECVRPINFDRALKKTYSFPRENSPSTGSAITIVLPDDPPT